jgi:SAM-dependent methyltransferase
MRCPPATRLLRHLRSLKKRWSPATDRVYHDELFKGQSFDSLDPSYAGRLTILRFADAAEPRLPEKGAVLDMGCGGGEILCEPARRRGDLSFLGVDHSEAGIEKARVHASRLKLSNARFEVQDVEAYEPTVEPALVQFFDSFHHFRDPGGLIRRLGARCERFFAIEPQGDWRGSWKRELDFDWLVAEVDKIRGRVDGLLGEEGVPSDHAPSGPPSHGEAVENRYSLEEFQDFFQGFSLDVRGTVAGLEAYPPNPYASSPARVFFNDVSYRLLKWVDDELFRRDLDLLARHWVIYAERGGQARVRALPRPLVGAPSHESVQGPYDMAFLSYDGPREAGRDQEIRATVRLRNSSYRTWTTSGDHPVRVSYHWLDRSGRVEVLDGERTNLPRPVGPSEECSVLLSARTPGRRGQFSLAIDLVEEGVCWFSDTGVPWLRIPFRVRGG